MQGCTAYWAGRFEPFVSEALDGPGASCSSGLRPWTGRVEYEKPGLPLGPRALVTAAGPLANLLAAAAGFAIAKLAPTQALTQFACFCAAAGVLNLMPLFSFDGRRLLLQWMTYRRMPVPNQARLAQRAELASFALLGGLTAYTILA